MEIEVLDKLYYTIGEVAEMLETSSSQLRYWSGEFNLNVRKNRKGDRLFQKTDVEKLKQIQQLLKDEGYTIDGAKKKLKYSKSTENKNIQSVISHEKSVDNSRILKLKNQLSSLKSQLEKLKVEIDLNLN